MNEEIAKKIIAGLDQNTLIAISSFGGEYINYLWWKNIIIPFLSGAIILFTIIIIVVFFTKKAMTEIKKEEKKEINKSCENS